MGGAPVRQPIDFNPQDARLDSWKDIAAYLNRSVPTVQRWEKEEGLPVHRHIHKKQGSVYAFKPELDDWRANRNVASDAGEVERPAPPETVPPPRIEFRWRKRLAISLVALLVVVAAVLVVRSKIRTTEPESRLMVAVLPFQNLGGGPKLDYVCDALTEELTTELAAYAPKQLGVIARTSAMVYRSGAGSVREIGGTLGAQYVVEGSVLFAEGKSRITVQLIRVSDQSHVWAHSYDSNIDDLLQVEQDIARSVAQEINVRLAENRQRPAKKNSSDPEARRLYVEGRQLWYRRSQRDLEQSVSKFEDAVRHDPNYAAAYAALADSYNQLGYLGFRPLGLTIPKAQAAAQKALELNPDSADANAALGFINAMWLWDWKEAEQQYQRSIELDPGYAPAHHYYALYLASAARLEEAEQEMEIAGKLDPLSPTVNSGRAYVSFFDRQYERSMEFCNKALQQDPQYAVALALRGWNLIQLKRYDEAIAELHKALDLSPENPLYIGTLGRAYFLSGRAEDGEKIIRQLNELSERKWVGGTAKAIVYAARGDRDNAMVWLQSAARQEDGLLLWLKVTPEFDSLRDDARFKNLVQKIGLPPSIQ